jgi:hypothetical protein
VHSIQACSRETTHCVRRHLTAPADVAAKVSDLWRETSESFQILAPAAIRRIIPILATVPAGQFAPYQNIQHNAQNDRRHYKKYFCNQAVLICTKQCKSTR